MNKCLFLLTSEYFESHEKLIWFSQNDEKFIILNNATRQKISIGMSNILAYILGATNQIGSEIDIFFTRNALLDTTEAFLYRPNVMLGRPKHAKIYCKEVKPLMFGGVFETIVSFYTLKAGRSSREAYFLEFNHPLEVDINHTSLDSLTFKLCPENSQNELLFEEKDIPVHLTALITRYYKN